MTARYRSHCTNCQNWRDLTKIAEKGVIAMIGFIMGAMATSGAIR